MPDDIGRPDMFRPEWHSFVDEWRYIKGPQLRREAVQHYADGLADRLALALAALEVCEKALVAASDQLFEMERHDLGMKTFDVGGEVKGALRILRGESDFEEGGA